MFRLDGKTAVIVGGAGYLGSSICRAMAAQGASVVVVDLNGDGAAQVAAEISGQSIACNLGDERAGEALIQQLREDVGQLDILVNATCAPHSGQGSEISVEAFTTSMQLNVAMTFDLARQAKSLMSAGGSMVLFSSMYGRVSPDPRAYEAPMLPNPIEYGVAKAGIEQMIRYLAVAWAGDGIRVNGVAPGPFPHPGVQAQHPQFMERLAARVPMGRIGRQDEVAGAVLFLASDAASYITGQTLSIDGGWTIW